jgi:hypothetical protein
MSSRNNIAVLKSNPEIINTKSTPRVDELDEHKEIMSVEEFRKFGYLQELNRLFLHPLGLSLCALISEDGTEILSDILDYRKEEVGFDDEIVSSIEFQSRIRNVEKELEKRKLQ